MSVVKGSGVFFGWRIICADHQLSEKDSRPSHEQHRFGCRLEKNECQLRFIREICAICGQGCPQMRLNTVWPQKRDGSHAFRCYGR